jgi:hypothetical protein
MVNIFETVSFLKSELFVELKFRRPSEWNGYSTWSANKHRLTLGDKIGTARGRLDALDMSGVLDTPIEDLFNLINKEEGHWLRLTELNMFDGDTQHLDNPKLFKELVPNLRKLNLGMNWIESFDKDVFKHAGKLLELELNLSRIKNRTYLTNETFHGLVNLRVLNINMSTFDSLELFNCLCNLEELTLLVNQESPFNRLETFPRQLSKLRVLKLNLRCEVEWIAPTAFDHLTCLEQFEFDCSKCYLNDGLEAHPLAIGITPRFLKIIYVKTLRLLGSESSVANIETIFCYKPNSSDRWHDVQLTKLESNWPLSGLKRLSAVPFDDKSLSFNQMLNLEVLSLSVSDFGVLRSSGLGSLCKLRELRVDFNYAGR